MEIIRAIKTAEQAGAYYVRIQAMARRDDGLCGRHVTEDCRRDLHLLQNGEKTKIATSIHSMKTTIIHVWAKVKSWLQSLSFRTGVIVLLCCIPFYILSFAQMLLPISAAAKGVLWTVLFGMAKACQYGGLTILGVEGYNRLKNWIRRKKE